MYPLHIVSIEAYDGQTVITTQCPICGVQDTFTIPNHQYQAWTQEGVPIQRAMPQLNAASREALMTGMCDKCFQEVFRED